MFDFRQSRPAAHAMHPTFCHGAALGRKEVITPALRSSVSYCAAGTHATMT